MLVLGGVEFFVCAVTGETSEEKQATKKKRKISKRPTTLKLRGARAENFIIFSLSHFAFPVKFK